MKNVGPPDSPTISSAAFDAIDSTMINITWTESTTYTENGQSIVFPNEDFHVSKYQYRYRWGPAQPWSEVQETTSTSAKLTGLDKTGYIFQVNAVNSEGESGWTETTIGELENQPPTVSSPSPSEVSYMFPFGKPGTLNYNSPAGADDDGDDLTYHFKVTLDEIVPAVDGFPNVHAGRRQLHHEGQQDGHTPRVDRHTRRRQHQGDRHASHHLCQRR